MEKFKIKFLSVVALLHDNVKYKKDQSDCAHAGYSHSDPLTLTTLNYFNINHGDQRGFQFKIIIKMS